MQSVTATFRNGRVELANSVDWPEGTPVEVKPFVPPHQERNHGEPPRTQWPAGFFDRLRQPWGDEGFERPPQGQTEVREDWS